MNDFEIRIRASVEEFKLTGASFAYWDGVTLHTATAGVRNSVTGDPVTVDTVMHIGSITKVFNAVLMMQLVDEGAIALEDPVLKHLPELRLKDRSALARITCAMLLNHTCGIDGDWLPEVGPDEERIVDAIERCADLGQAFPPGEAVSYCNIGTVIAGYLTQRLRKTSWYTLVKTRLFEPLGMRDALADVIDAPRFRCSVGDLTDPVTGAMTQTTRAFLSPSFAPAGSTLMTSAVDLITFARTLLNGGVTPNGARMLSSASVARMMEPCGAFAAPGYQIGLGWMIGPGGVLTHGGVGPGVQSALFAHPQTGRAVALLTNCDRGNVLRSTILEPLVASWTGGKPGSKDDGSRVEPRLYEGVFENNLQRIEVFSRDGGLAMRVSMKMRLYDNSPYGDFASRWPESALHPRGDHAFEADPMLPRGARTELRFVRPDATGQMRCLGMGYRLLVRTR